MAEAIWNDLGRNRWKADSAGSKPAGYVHPLAIAAMQEKDVDLSDATSKHVDQFADEPIDLVVTVCDNAKEACPAFVGAIKTLHWPFDDPADATGSDDDKMKCFRRVRDEIHAKIAEHLN